MTLVKCLKVNTKPPSIDYGILHFTYRMDFADAYLFNTQFGTFMSCSRLQLVELHK